MAPFREWFESRFGVPYPGVSGELAHTVLSRVAEGLAEYVDLAVQELKKQEEKS